MKFPPLNITNYKTKLYKKYKVTDTSLETQKHEIALQISGVGLWDWDRVTNKVFYSAASKQIIGYKEKELKNTSKFWDDKVHPKDKDHYYSTFKLHLDGTVDLYENEYRVLCKDGTYKWILDKGKVIEHDHNGKPKRIIGTHTDITKSKKHESQLNKNLQLITNQNKRLHNFTHIVSHNLKTHIGNFKNILEFYDQAVDTTEKIELIGHLNSISESLTTTIVDLDDIISIKSKSDIKQLNEHVNLHECANKIIESLKIESKHNDVTIYNALRMDNALWTNRSYFESIIYNLISNGIKYSDPNKKPQIIIQSVYTKNGLKILIADNGIGIDTSRYKNQLFEMYQTFHGTDRKDSRGIGLYITKTQVKALGGEIELDSSPNIGSTFTLTFQKQKRLS